MALVDMQCLYWGIGMAVGNLVVEMLAEPNLHWDDTALMVHAHENRKEEIKAYPRPDKHSCPSPACGKLCAGEEEWDHGEEEAWFLVGYKGEDRRCDDRRDEVR